MKRRRKIIVYIATSADGYIARADGSVDWLNRPRPAGNYGMGAFFRSIDTILWGRKTYAPMLAKGGKGGGFGPKVKNYVFSHRPPPSPAPDVEFVNEPVSVFAQRLRGQPGKDIWMMGGAGLIASFLDAGELDEFIIHVIPIFIGEGIPLIQPQHRLVPLELRSARRFSDGVVRLHYNVRQSATARKPARKRAAGR
jgi:dihydrofolate reductase